VIPTSGSVSSGNVTWARPGGRFPLRTLPPRAQVRAAAEDGISPGVACLISYWLTTRALRPPCRRGLGLGQDARPGGPLSRLPLARDGRLQRARATSGIMGVHTVVEQVKPTILIGCSTAHGAFTQQVVETMSAGTRRPVIFLISNPTSQIEAVPADIIAWSGGKALVATGLPMPPVDYAGVTYSFGQANNALLYPGLGLGTIVAGASKVTDGMLLAAAEAVAGQVDVSAPGASSLPQMQNLRASSATTAVDVTRAAAEDGVATVRVANPVQAVQDAMWQPAYPDAVS
jgi:malate dehydrogenase (oxaloacetate-decarboxylating)